MCQDSNNSLANLSIKIPHKGTYSKISSSKCLTQARNFGLWFWKRHQVSSYGKTWVRKSRRLHIEKKSWHFWFIRSHTKGTQRIVTTTKIRQRPKYFDCHLGGRNEDCSCGQRWLWMPRYIKSESFFWKPGTVKNPCDKKTNDLSWQLCSTSFKCLAKTKTEETKPLVREN